VSNGTGIRKQGWDTFYVVATYGQGQIKIGVSQFPRTRLRRHWLDGFRITVRLLTGLPAGTAHAMERAVLATLHDAGHVPWRGHEYFYGDALAAALEVTDKWQPQE
jgi:hypothetical protein